MKCTKLRAVLALSFGAVLLLGVVCKRNHAPSIPDVTGRLTYRPADTVRLSTMSTDQDDDLVSYLFAWGDTSSAIWSSDYPSGVKVTRGHVFVDSGVYAVRTRARDDNGAESDWSSTETLRVGFFAPGTPTRPLGPTTGLRGVGYEYSTRATSPYGESLLIQFDWDGELGSWGGPVASDSQCTGAHAFDSGGLYAVRARAGDIEGRTSAWSDSLMVAVAGANRPPGPPEILGPVVARPGDPLAYGFTSTDPDGDSVFFMISWRSGDSTPWSPASPSGGEYTQIHSYTDTGTYYVKAKARDGKDAESGWSDSVRVRIGSFPPEAPIRPTGPTRCSTGLAYVWSTRASHPLHDSVRIQFSWGEGTIDSFGHMVASNASFDTTHTYSLPGTYPIAARARDAAGFESPWSETLLVTVDTSSIVPRGAPHNLVLTAATDSTVNIVWAVDSTPSRYVVLFRETGTPNFDSVGSALTTSYVHDPAHRTGQYRVAAIYDTSHVPSAEAPSTTPHWNSPQWLPELSSIGLNTGYGWDRTTGEASFYDMTVLDSFAKVDFYFTDFAPGFAGPNFYAASPDTAPLDPGGAVPFGAWHTTEFIHLDSTATEDSILPGFGLSPYRKCGLLDSLPRLVAGYTTIDDYYALLYVSSIDTINGTADIETWFQKIKGLRLIEH